MNALKRAALLCALLAPALFAQSNSPAPKDSDIAPAPNGGAVAPMGIYAGFGVPTFTCLAPCAFIRADRRNFTYITSGTPGYPSNAWVQVRPKRKRWMIFGRRRAN